jgi:hypothetical protein
LSRAAIVDRVYSTSGAKSMPDTGRILSIKYAHPAGRAGFALAKAIVADLRNESEAVKPQGAARLGSFARITMPGMPDDRVYDTGPINENRWRHGRAVRIVAVVPH